MSKALKAALGVLAKASASRCSPLPNASKQTVLSTQQWFSSILCPCGTASPAVRGHASIASILQKPSYQTVTSGNNLKSYSTEVDKEIAKFLEKEIQFEQSRASKDLPKIVGFEVVTDGGDVTLSKNTGSEKVVVKLSVNGAVDSILSEGDGEKQNEPPQIVCRPPFDVELCKEDGTVVAFQCSFPAPEEPFEEAPEYAKGDQEGDRIDDQFEIQEVAIHNGEWKDTTFSVSAATMDAELFDLLMDMLDERGINDEFISQLVDFCTAYENKQYISFLNKLKAVAEK